MKKSLVLAMVMALGVTASAYAANPFSDVPAGHWAYDSVAKLAAAGVIEGYGDTTFGGDKLMTRYEMAQIVAKAMAKGANVDKLAAEFADELNNLGVRVAKLEKKADNVKITGAIKYQARSYHGTKTTNNWSRLRSDLTFKGTINEDWTYTALLRNEERLDKGNKNSGEEHTRFQRAYVNGKLGGLKVQAGRYHYNEGIGGIIYQGRVDGVQVSYGKDIKLTAGYAQGANSYQVTSGSGKGDDDADYIYYAALEAKLGKAVTAKAAYYKFSDITKTVAGVEDSDNKIWAVGAAANFSKDLKLSAYYFNSDNDIYGDDGVVAELRYKGAKAAKAGSFGLYGTYYYLPGAAMVAPAGISDNADYFKKGLKGYRVGAEYALAKGIVAHAAWYALEGRFGAEEGKHKNTLLTEVIFSF